MNYVVAGGGITGLMAARILLERIPKAKITIIEKSEVLGGLLQTIHDPRAGDFDCGIHTLYDTGIPELNALLRGILPESDWIFNHGVRRDLGGAYVNGKLQINSPYYDLRNLPREKYHRAVEDFFSFFHSRAPLNEASGNAAQHLENRYGKYIAQELLAPILEKAFQCPADKLHPFAVRLLPLDRVVMFNQGTMDELILSSALRSHLAYPDQRELPAHLIPKKSSFYPRRYGMRGVIEALREKLVRSGVTILTSSQITEIKVNRAAIERVSVARRGEAMALHDVKELYWTCGIPLLARLLKLPSWDLPATEKPSRTSIVNFLIDSSEALADIFYAYCFEKGFLVHRLSSPYNLCPNAVRSGLYPFSVELIHRSELTDAELVSRTMEECFTIGAFSWSTKVLWSGITHLPSGYPNLSCASIEELSYHRENLLAREISGLCLLGILANDKLFYQTDIFEDSYLKIMS